MNVASFFPEAHQPVVNGGTLQAANKMVIYNDNRIPIQRAVKAGSAALASAREQNEFVKENKERCKILIQRCQNLCDQIQCDGLPDSMQNNIHVLESVCTSIKDIVTQLASRSFAWRLLHQDKIDRDIKAAEAKLLDAISIFSISAQVDNTLLQREIAESMSEAAVKDQTQLVAHLDSLSQNDHKILNSLQENHLRLEELLVALVKNVQENQLSASAIKAPSDKFIRHAVGALQRLSRESIAKVSVWQVTSLEVTFDRDEPDSQVGQGSFGTVFKGQWHGEAVAVKEMYVEDARSIDRKALKSVQNEIAIWSRLTHPRILQFYGACLEATRPFIVSRFCPNGNVLDYLRKNPSKNRLHILHEVSLGMTYLHNQSVIHADLKGANILIDTDGKALISDFGISQLQDQAGTSTLNRTGMEITQGTRRWMAPEILDGEKLNFPADVYAFGITAWELYTLEVPFSNVHDRALCRRVIDKQERPKCPSTMNDNLVSLASKCWAHEVAERPNFKVVSLSISTIVDKEEREMSLKAIRAAVEKRKAQEEVAAADQKQRENDAREEQQKLQKARKELEAREEVAAAEQKQRENDAREEQQTLQKARKELEAREEQERNERMRQEEEREILQREEQMAKQRTDARESEKMGESLLPLYSVPALPKPVPKPPSTLGISQGVTNMSFSSLSPQHTALTVPLPTLAQLQEALPMIQQSSYDPGLKLAWCRDIFFLIDHNQKTLSPAADPPPGPVTITDPVLAHLAEIAVPTVLQLAEKTGWGIPDYVAEAVYIRASLGASGAFPKLVPAKPRAAFRDFETAARGGYAPAWFRLGQDYERFDNSILAKDCFERGVKLDVQICLYRMGMAHLLGQLGLPASPETAIPLLHRAATRASLKTPQLAYVYALLLLSEFTLITVPPQSFAPYIPTGSSPLLEARKHLELAAYLHFVPAQFKLGYAYEHAQPPFPFDALMSVQYYSLASQQGNEEADMALSKWFLTGSAVEDGGFERDEALALIFAEKAAKKGLPSAEFAMGYFAETGTGQPKDVKTAIAWYSKACDHGNMEASDRLNALSKPLSCQEHEILTVNTLVRKRALPKQRFDEQLVSSFDDSTTSPQILPEFQASSMIPSITPQPQEPVGQQPILLPLNPASPPPEPVGQQPTPPPSNPASRPPEWIMQLPTVPLLGLASRPPERVGQEPIFLPLNPITQEKPKKRSWFRGGR